MTRLLAGLIRQNRGFLSNTLKRTVYKFNFDSDEEIIENVFKNFILIGINLPDSKNLLTETALEKLCKSLESFQSNDEIISAVLHGTGGNFCTGCVPTESARSKSRELIEILHKGKKPVIASLNGYTSNFGFQLALMCDIRVMDELAVASFGCNNERSEIPELIYQKLVMTVGSTKSMEMILTKCSWMARSAQEAGFSNRTAECGSALSQCIIWAQSIGQNHSFKRVLEEKAKINSAVNKILS